MSLSRELGGCKDSVTVGVQAFEGRDPGGAGEGGGGRCADSCGYQGTGDDLVQASS